MSGRRGTVLPLRRSALAFLAALPLVPTLSVLAAPSYEHALIASAAGGSVDQGVSHLKTEAEHDTTKAALRALGTFLSTSGRPLEGAAVFRSLLQADPGDPWALHGIGRASVASKQDLEEAARCLKLYLESPPPPNGPSPAAARYRLAQIYELQGNKAAAMQEVRQAVRMDPDQTEYRKLLRALQ